MRKIASGRRLLGLIVTLVQLTIGFVLPISHASAEAIDLSHAVHIQAAGDDVCVPHADDKCPTCRAFGSAMQLSTGRTGWLASNESVSSSSFTQPEAFGAQARYQPIGSRAPPPA